MQAEVIWKDGLSFEGNTGSGHSVVMDASPDHGGANKGARPMEVVLLGLGGCASIDVMLMLKKARQDVTDCKVVIEASRADAVPAVFTSIHLKFVISGNNLQEKHVARACELSATKYCSVSKMLEEGGVEVSHSYQI